jgi:hypothetical protein
MDKHPWVVGVSTAMGAHKEQNSSKPVITQMQTTGDSVLKRGTMKDWKEYVVLLEIVPHEVAHEVRLRKGEAMLGKCIDIDA